eukprot:31772-Pleurochrysis_carterae.AAC.7
MSKAASKEARMGHICCISLSYNEVLQRVMQWQNRAARRARASSAAPDRSTCARRSRCMHAASRTPSISFQPLSPPAPARVAAHRPAALHQVGERAAVHELHRDVDVALRVAHAVAAHERRLRREREQRRHLLERRLALRLVRNGDLLHGQQLRDSHGVM